MSVAMALLTLFFHVQSNIEEISFHSLRLIGFRQVLLHWDNVGVAVLNETKEYFTHNLVIWRVFVWLYGLITLGHLVLFRLVIWQSFVR